MVDWEEIQTKAKKDMECCLRIWSELLEDFLGDRLSYAYAKGSCIKKWDNPIDYVPILSDVDVHVNLTDGVKLFPETTESFKKALEMNKLYEQMFLAERPDHLHLPRMQIMTINALIQSTSIEYVPPRLEDVYVMNGKPSQAEIPPVERIREIDAAKMEEQEEFIHSLPNRIFDRTGLDFWGLIRCGGLGWRVSPSPVRLITQRYPDPIEAWNWNRTQTCKVLEDMGYRNIANSYTSFYEHGWDLFLSDFKNSNSFRSITSEGYNVLKMCLEEVRNIRASLKNHDPLAINMREGLR